MTGQNSEIHPSPTKLDKCRIFDGLVLLRVDAASPANQRGSFNSIRMESYITPQ